MAVALENGFEKVGPLLGNKRPEWSRFHLLVSFSHQRVGSSILASLSEVNPTSLNKGLSCVFNNLAVRIVLNRPALFHPVNAIYNAICTVRISFWSRCRS